MKASDREFAALIDRAERDDLRRPGGSGGSNGPYRPGASASEVRHEPISAAQFGQITRLEPMLRQYGFDEHIYDTTRASGTCVLSRREPNYDAMYATAVGFKILVNTVLGFSRYSNLYKPDEALIIRWPAGRTLILLFEKYNQTDDGFISRHLRDLPAQRDRYLRSFKSARSGADVQVELALCIGRELHDKLSAHLVATLRAQRVPTFVYTTPDSYFGQIRDWIVETSGLAEQAIFDTDASGSDDIARL